MKMMLAAIAMTIASPAFAQAAAPTDAHAQHSPQTDTADHAAHTGQADGHEGHDMTGGCCEKDADGKMACCEKAAADAPAADPHADHDMSQH